MEDLGYDLNAAATLTALSTDNGHGIRGIDAYLLGYDNIVDAVPLLAASVADGAFVFSFAGTVPRSIDGISVSYKVQKSSDNSNWSVATTTSAGSGALSLALDDAGLYNRLVAEIAAAE